MERVFPPALDRRQILKWGAAALAAVGSLPARRVFAAGGMSNPTRLVAAAGEAALVGGAHPATRVFAYDGRVPGPVLRIPQGQPFRIVADNRLGEDTTVHWHGIRLPNAMDGVPGLTQPPIEPGDSFTYAFTPPDAGTFLYHPHDHSLEQMGRGLAGALIVAETEPPPVDRELVWVVQDWRLGGDAQIAAGFGNGMEAAMSGRVGNTVTIGGQVPGAVPVRAGERSAALVNAAIGADHGAELRGPPAGHRRARRPALRPARARDGRLLLGPAMRADLMLDMQGEPGSRSTGSATIFTAPCSPTPWSSSPTAPLRRCARTRPTRSRACRRTRCRSPISPRPRGQSCRCKAG